MRPDKGRPGLPPTDVDREASGVDVPLPAIGQFTMLDTARATLLARWCGELIPSRAGRPSAAQFGAAEYIDQVCSSSPVLRCALIVALDGLAAASQEQHGQPFTECSRPQRVACLEAFASADPDSFGLVQRLVYEAYYSVPAVLALLERATGWRSGNAVTGSQMVPFDESTTDRVRSLPPGYRDPERPES